ncbi:MAG TPA: radical SAM protein, partial [Spirochaetia bacterium]|nr:radical SAM protein [Spirochaetia bacterium]
SLGINNIPAKVCTYACVYCQVGRTTRMVVEREQFYEPQAIVREADERLREAGSRSERVDYLTFVPDGEATLDINLGREIGMLKGLGVPIGVITNSTLLWCEDVREELASADWVSLKVDSLRDEVWRKINRPHKGLALHSILEGMRSFARAFAGKLVTETMLVEGVNDSESGLQEVADFIRSLHPSRAYLSVPTRPPAMEWVRPVCEETLARAHEIFAAGLEQVEYLVDYEGDAFVSTGDVSSDLLSIASVHPMRAEAVEALLKRAGASWDIVEQLVQRGDLKNVSFGGHLYYLRRFIK